MIPEPTQPTHPLKPVNPHPGVGRALEIYDVDSIEQHPHQYLWLAPARIISGPLTGKYRFVGRETDSLKVEPVGWCGSVLCDGHDSMEDAAHHFLTFLLARCLTFYAPGPGRLRRCQHRGQKTTAHALMEYDYFQRTIPLCAEHHQREVVAGCFALEDF